MASSYKRLYIDEGNHYLEDCPVILRAGALLRHNESGTLIAQLKLQNIDNRIIAAVRVKLRFYTPAREDAGVQQYNYLDLAIQPGETFGSGSPIVVQNELARSFTAIAEQVVFADGTVWDNEKPFSGKLGPLQKLSAVSDEPCFINEMRKMYGPDTAFIPVNYGAYWNCTCGTVNRSTNTECIRCGNKPESLTGVDYPKLASELKKDELYANALSIEEKAYKETDFQKALDIFSSLSGWKDSAEHIASCQSAINYLKESRQQEKAEREKAVTKTKSRLPIVLLILLLIALGGYAIKNTVSTLGTDPGEAYDLGLKYFAEESYGKAQKYFEMSEEPDAEKYIKVIDVRQGEADITTLKDMLDFEPARETLLWTEELADPFLRGSWQSEDEEWPPPVSFELVDNDYNTDIPAEWFGDTYGFEKGTFYGYKGKDKKAVMTFKVIDWDQVEITSIKYGDTYTLYRDK